ncbi:PREDICTED: uncharacterized protein LOC108560641 [Nicrophorus vespilloides]|uniref:Uncharacterized protein LOC108560641 n=1 Tax=Nicrophorus vespilloides TaxID=110193 RepID=A0ABM1MGR7_NICVS|nr:PREDICTED: uncharacterized protein LOC108560641 [Nicrophorus vespilloides]
MEFKLCALVLLAICSFSAAYPANIKDVSEEVDIVPLEGRRPSAHIPAYFDEDFDDVGVVDTGYFPSSYNPFSGFYSGLEAMMRSMREQLAFILNNLPARSNRTEDGLPGLGVFGNVDLSKGNTTSVTKVIDGHKVVINETQYENKDENGGSFYKVRIINVLPDSEETTNGDSEETTNGDSEIVPVTESHRDVEPIEDSLENEIEKSDKEGSSRSDHIETFDEVDSLPSKKNIDGEWDDAQWNDIDQYQNVLSNDIESVDNVNQNFRDLSNDIDVNEILANNNAPINPDAEYFVITDMRTPHKLP